MKSYDNPENLSQCPFRGTRVGGALGSGPQIDDWWPNRLKVELLHQNPAEANPLHDVDYKAAFNAINYDQLKADIKAMLTESKAWWPADYGNYGPQMVRMAWHSAGTYRIADGRGGAAEAMQRFAPINSWWDNGNIDKSRRLIWPIKQKYGAAISWADLIILTGNCALEIMGFKTFGFGAGRIDAWEPDRGTYWGSEFWDGKRVGEVQTQKDSSASKCPVDHGSEKYAGHPGEMVTRTQRWEGEPGDEYYDLENPLAATNQALIYVDPEGPNGNGKPLDSALDIRETFARMAMDDEETVALIAGGHAFGKSHGMVSAEEVGPAPEGAPIQAMGLGWQNPEGTGFAQYTMTNGIEGSWTPNPIQWDNDYLKNLFTYDWEQTKSPAGAVQWKPKTSGAPKTPDAHEEGKMNELMMMTSDLALKEDPIYREICLKFIDDFDYFSDVFARAWYKLTHRDMGPKVRYLGPEVAEEELAWQDPIPACDHELINDQDIAGLKAEILSGEIPATAFISAAWASASNYRHTDKRGGANGARVRLDPQINWAVNRPDELKNVLAELESVQSAFNAKQSGNKRVSLADLIILAGAAALEQAAQASGVDAQVPFAPGRMDAAQKQTDIESFEWLKPVSDGFRNYHDDSVGYHVHAEQIFLDRAHLLSLTAPEWTVLVGGLRVLDQNWDHSSLGVFTDNVGVLSNDFFKVLTSMDYAWEPANKQETLFNVNSRDTGEIQYTASRCDLIFGSNAQLRAIAEVYASDDGHQRMVKDFIKAWDKVMMLDRFDLEG
ncbi:MAG: catalase/peroxidase HPI [Pseudomonadota bacterium]|nr:catalase/peroxidase HPI [Pseudomonadota bacterium]